MRSIDMNSKGLLVSSLLISIIFEMSAASNRISSKGNNNGIISTEEVKMGLKEKLARESGKTQGEQKHQIVDYSPKRRVPQLRHHLGHDPCRHVHHC
ncbi:unnamed protein product [Cylicocyclus nassatus]|uniref:Uncharacterized protein n=1 Tax=Cylicocyclus nassatus TaxID=53992 RepID=A0AA36GNI4_CYLNA|nr:unnamed protein product [Cylicocyclus nassatus]